MSSALIKWFYNAWACAIYGNCFSCHLLQLDNCMMCLSYPSISWVGSWCKEVRYGWNLHTSFHPRRWCFHVKKYMKCGGQIISSKKPADDLWTFWPCAKETFAKHFDALPKNLDNQFLLSGLLGLGLVQISTPCGDGSFSGMSSVVGRCVRRARRIWKTFGFSILEQHPCIPMFPLASELPKGSWQSWNLSWAAMAVDLSGRRATCPCPTLTDTFWSATLPCMVSWCLVRFKFLRAWAMMQTSSAWFWITMPSTPSKSTAMCDGWTCSMSFLLCGAGFLWKSFIKLRLAFGLAIIRFHRRHTPHQILWCLGASIDFARVFHGLSYWRMKETSCIESSLAQILQPLRGNNRPRQGFLFKVERWAHLDRLNHKKSWLQQFVFNFVNPF